MIKSLSIWAEQIVVAVIIATLIEVILPNGNNKKYIKAVIGVYILFTIISPIFGNMKSFDFDNFDYETYFKNTQSYQTMSDSLISHNNQSTEEIYLNNLKQDMKQKLKEKGYLIEKIAIQLELNKEGQAKLQEISQSYALLGDEIDEIEKQQKDEKEEEKSEEKQTKKVSVLTIGETEYDIYKIEKNKIIVKIGSETSNNTSINTNMSKAAEIAMLINSGKYPLTYEIENNRYTYSDISEKEILYFSLIILAIILVISIIFIIKYKIKGLLGCISNIGFIALFSLLLRYTNVLISIEGIGAIILIIAINLKLIQDILNKTQKINMIDETIVNTYKKMSLKLIPIVIISLTFCFSGWTNLSSFGMVMFWGLILMAVYNILVTKTLLKLKENK